MPQVPPRFEQCAHELQLRHARHGSEPVHVAQTCTSFFVGRGELAAKLSTDEATAQKTTRVFTA